MTIALTTPTRPVRRVFLGVERSACGRAWRDRLDERDSARALAIAQRHDDMPELLARILAGRGIEVDAVAAFLDPTVRALMPDPDTLAGMGAAATRLADAITRSETVAILGDYDVDGATSSAVLGRYLRHCGLAPFIHIPTGCSRVRAECRGSARARRARRYAARDGRLRHDEPRTARGGGQARPRDHRHRPSPG